MKPELILVYDGACKFCIQNAEWIFRWFGKDLSLKSFHDVDFLETYPYLKDSDYEQQAILVEIKSDKRIVYSGAEAFFRLLHYRWYTWLFSKLYYIPILRVVFDLIYGNISKYRFHLKYWQ